MGPLDREVWPAVVAACTVAGVYIVAGLALARWYLRVRRRRMLLHSSSGRADEPAEVIVEFVEADPSDPDWIEMTRQAHRHSARVREFRDISTRPSVLAMLFIVLAVLGIPTMLACGYYAFHIEPYRLDVTEIVIPMEAMRGHPPLRIVQISDLHSDGTARVEPLLRSRIEELHPDIVVFTGDINNGSRKRPDGTLDDSALIQSADTLQEIAMIRPQASFACMGNRDTANSDKYTPLVRPGEFNGDATDPLPPERRLTLPYARETEVWDVIAPYVKRYKGFDFRVLVGETVRYERPGDGLVVHFAGGGVYDKPLNEIEMALDRMDRARKPGDITVLLGHYPSMWRFAQNHRVDLHLAGDTHNGQIVFPLLGPLVRKVTIDGYFYGNFLYAFPRGDGQGTTYTYVNRGLGMDNTVGPPARFLCAPEITLIRLVSPDDGTEATPVKRVF